MISYYQDPYCRRIALIVSVLFWTGSSYGADSIPSYQDNFCKGSEVLHLTRPIHPGRKDSPVFEFNFRYITGSVADLPTIIFLPGGPGATSIFMGGFQDVGLGIPKSYPLVLTDPRGTGCNGNIGSKLPDDAHSTDIWADDVISIIHKMNLKNYIIMGHSYGTVLATVVASKIQKDKNRRPPSAVVLLGTLGHAFTKDSEQYEGLVNGWEKLKQLLSPEIVTQLSQSRLPLGISSEGWGRFLFKGLVAGAGPAIPPEERLLEQLQVLNSKDEEKIEKLKASVLQAASHVSSQEYLKASRPIWCRELARFDNTDLALENGNLIGFINSNFCDKMSLDYPYDSAKFNVSAPIFYFQGEDDYAVTMAQAEYHFHGQEAAHRFFVSVPEAGHFSIAALSDCISPIWRSISLGGVNFQEALNSCKWKTRVIVAESHSL